VRAFRITLKALAWLFLGTLALVVSTLLIAVTVARSDWGHRKLLAVALPKINARLEGRVRIGRLDGNLTRLLVLREVEIDDKEHRPAIRVRMLAVRYNLLSLLRHRIDVRALEAEGAWVHVRPLADGKLNLAELLPASPPSSKPYRVQVGKVVADVETIYDPPPGPNARRVHATVRLAARGNVDGGQIELAIASLTAHLHAPLSAFGTLRGELSDRDGGIAAHNLALAVVVDGRELQRLVPTVRLRGQWHLDLFGEGPADKLVLSLVARPPAGQLEVAAEVNTRGGQAGQRLPSLPRLDWRARVKAQGIDPAKAIAGAPRGSVRLDAHGGGRGPYGRVNLGRLDALVAGVTVHARGHFDTAGDGDGVARIDAPDLSQLRTVGVTHAAGTLHAAVKLARARHALDIDADATGKNVSLGANHVGTLALHVHTHEFLGTATLRAERVHTQKIALDRLHLHGRVSRDALVATLTARGPKDMALAVALHGRPTLARHQLRVIGADVSIDRLALHRHDEAVTVAHPSQLNVHEVVTLAPLILTSGNQQLVLAGKFNRETQAIDLAVTGKGLDLLRIARFVRPSLDLPTTALDVTLEAHGTVHHPVAALHVAGWSEQQRPADDRSHGERVHYDAELHYADKRAHGRFAINGVDESVTGMLDLPLALTGERPLALAMQIKNVTTQHLRRVLPARLARLEGRIDGNVALAGTTQRPRLDLMLHGRGLALPEAKGNDVLVTIAYGARKLDAKLAVTLARSSGGDGGAVAARVTLPVTLSAAALRQRRHLMTTLRDETPIDLDMTLRKIDLTKVPFASLGLAPPLSAGQLDGSVRLDGTLRQPRVAARLAGHGLRKGRLNRLDVTADIEYEATSAKARLEAHLRDATLLRAQATASLDLARIIDGARWQDAPLSLDAEVPRYPLARLADLVPKLDGTLTLAASARGKLARFTGKLDGNVAGLNLGAMRYDRLVIDGGSDGQRVTAHLDAREIKGGTLRGDVDVPFAREAPLRARLDASGFYVDLESLDLTNPRLLKGRLDTQLAVAGTRVSPTLQGELRFSDGEIALAQDPRIYDRVKLDLHASDGKVVINTVEAHLSDGSLTANGNLTLAGLTPRSVELKAHAHRFPVEPGSFGLWIDADVIAHGQGDAHGMSGVVTVDEGTANLPKLSTGKKLQPTGPLKDVRFVDAAALAAARRREQAEKSAATTQLTALIPGPFHVRSKELSTDLRGKLEVAIVGPVTRIRGHVEQMSNGWLELLGRRYNIDKASIGFTGEAEPNPELDIRLTRDITDTTIVIEVRGTAQKPQLVLASDPPIYDQSQVIALVLSGDPASQRVADRSLDQRVTGAISSVVVGKIKDQLAPHLPLDVIKVDTGTTGATGLGDTRLEVGKYLTDTIYVSYVHQFGSVMVGTQRFNSNEATLNWRFYRQYELDTAFGDAAVGHVNLFWTLRY
jgi:translocation and assembly module TamB